MTIALNVVAFQVGWFACVLGAAYGWPWAGVAAAAAAVAWHTWRAARPAQELKLVAVAVLVGALWDSTLVAAGWISFAPDAFAENLAPYWILAMWALFSTTLNISLGCLPGRVAAAALLCLLAGPAGCWAGGPPGAR